MITQYSHKGNYHMQEYIEYIHFLAYYLVPHHHIHWRSGEHSISTRQWVWLTCCGRSGCNSGTLAGSCPGRWPCGWSWICCSPCPAWRPWTLEWDTLDVMDIAKHIHTHTATHTHTHTHTHTQILIHYT